MPYFTLIPYLFLGRSKFAGYIDERRLENEILRSRSHPAEWESGDATDAGALQNVSERARRAAPGPADTSAIRRSARSRVSPACRFCAATPCAY